MVVAAHPDDVESWCGGTLALCVDAGAKVRMLLVTSGDKRARDSETSPTQIAVKREQESREAAEHLGLSEVIFLRHSDSEVEDSRELRRQLVMWTRRWRPQVVFTHDPEQPWPPYLSHRDHRVSGRATLDAVYPLARDALTFPEHREAGLLPHDVNEVWLFGTNAADTYVDIDKGFERKLKARLAHTSQSGDERALRLDWESHAQAAGRSAGLGRAEAFKVLKLG